MKIIKLTFISVLTLVFAGFCSSKLKNDVLVEPIAAINEFLPDSVKLIKENGEDAIEFCPDNTCELFVAKKEVSEEALKDFFYLYVYFVSDYYVLDEWRKQKNSAIIAKTILSKQKYKNCNEKTNVEKVHCLLEYLAKGDNISLYDVRYDENYRSKEKKELSEVLKITQAK